MRGPEYYLVRAEALPAVYSRVVEARRMMESGECATVGDACRAVDISRSAYYKYKDAVLPFYDMVTGRIVTFYSVLEDSPGLLSRILEKFAAGGVNILTINQSIPINGNAQLTIAADTGGMTLPLEHLIESISDLAGVVKFEILARSK